MKTRIRMAAVRTWRLSRLRLVGNGNREPDGRVELLAGRLVPAEPPVSAHVTAVALAADALRAAFGAGWHVRVQAPLAFGRFSEPEPDLCVVRGGPRDYRDAHPAEAALVVEVALGSLRLDQTLKKRIYAAAGVADYWIVNLTTEALEVYREPVAVTRRQWEYRRVQTFAPGEPVSPLAAPDASLDVTDLLP